MINAVANWKLNGSASFCHDWFDEFNASFHGDPSAVAIAPPAIYIPLCNELKKNNLNICAQNLDYSTEAARTGEISLEMLKDMDCSMSIIGHSERRNIFGETSEIIRNKLEKIASHTFTSIYCIGESLAEYDSGKSLEAIKNQLDNELLSLKTNIKLYIAYEPIWAIGSGKLPSTQEIESMHGFIEDTLSLFDNINVLGILYGGSVSVENSQELSESELIDGVLVGGASLNGKSFAKIASSFDKV
jgi:triosephosphate isomerase